MNEELKAIVIRAGAPAEMLGEMWFHIFCQRFVQEILDKRNELRDLLDFGEPQSD